MNYQELEKLQKKFESLSESPGELEAWEANDVLKLIDEHMRVLQELFSMATGTSSSAEDLARRLLQKLGVFPGEIKRLDEVYKLMPYSPEEIQRQLRSQTQLVNQNPADRVERKLSFW